ncbi:MAG TPA: hypothetical protein VM915_12460 [Verrucomicrobiae bacterium]|nr:hypothetical protein [Verrucomicrobiae bacterium]
MRADRDQLEGKVEGGARVDRGFTRGHMSVRLDTKAPLTQRFGLANTARSAHGSIDDSRQRAVVKIHYFSHAGGGGAALKAHARYVERDGAGRDDPPQPGALGTEEPQDAQKARAHADYLAREGSASQAQFYDATDHGIDGAARVETWARSDKRHFRVIFSAENGDRLGDLPAYTREVMARAEAALGTKLQWVAVDHHDTVNPHTHLIVRGRRANGQDLVIPKDFLKHGFRGVARDVATEWLGRRSLADERRALDRDVLRHAPTRLDRMIEVQLSDEGRASKLEAPNGDPNLTRALKERARELVRMGLARKEGNVLWFNTGWREALMAMERHIDIRKTLMHARAQGVSLQVPRVRNVGLDRG